ncbi:MAG: hypothetical protein LBB60_04120 [Desulfovibrio sp.]|jgi:hypothetical protein|nr:hypothetical protein [Desulfovibrio sp.]
MNSFEPSEMLEEPELCFDDISAEELYWAACALGCLSDLNWPEEDEDSRLFLLLPVALCGISDTRAHALP